jgi:hypothetical protein
MAPAAISVPARSPRGTTPVVKCSSTRADGFGRPAGRRATRPGSARTASNGPSRRTSPTVTCLTAANTTCGSAATQTSCTSLASKRGSTSSSNDRGVLIVSVSTTQTASRSSSLRTFPEPALPSTTAPLATQRCWPSPSVQASARVPRLVPGHVERRSDPAIATSANCQPRQSYVSQCECAQSSNLS